MTMAVAAAEATGKQLKGPTSLEQSACPVCGGKLRTLGPRRGRCKKGHTVTYCPELINAADCFSPAWGEGTSDGPGLSSVVGTRPRQTEGGQPGQAGTALPWSEEIAEAKAAWARKLKRQRQRRWRARKRAGLV